MKKVKWLHIGKYGLEFSPHYYEGKFHGYIYWFYWWNWLRPGFRYLGYEQDWYDGPMSSFGFWFINWSWNLPFTNHRGTKGWSIRDY